MAKVIGIMGESGSGKTTSMRNLDPKLTFYIDADRKGLNWKGWKKQYSVESKNYYSTNKFDTVQTLLNKIDTQENMKHIKYVVIDTLNGLMQADEMRILAMQSGDKRSAWSDLAQNGWALLETLLSMRDDLTAIVICHSETLSDENGVVRTRIKTNGRKLEKIVLESKMTTVLWTVRKSGEYKFILHSDFANCKTPLGSFDNTDECPNDITIILKALEDY